jgi:hypothetical protein
MPWNPCNACQDLRKGNCEDCLFDEALNRVSELEAQKRASNDPGPSCDDPLVFARKYHYTYVKEGWCWYLLRDGKWGNYVPTIKEVEDEATRLISRLKEKVEASQIRCGGIVAHQDSVGNICLRFDQELLDQFRLKKQKEEAESKSKLSLAQAQIKHSLLDLATKTLDDAQKEIKRLNSRLEDAALANDCLRDEMHDLKEDYSYVVGIDWMRKTTDAERKIAEVRAWIEGVADSQVDFRIDVKSFIKLWEMIPGVRTITERNKT